MKGFEGQWGWVSDLAGDGSDVDGVGMYIA